MDKEVLKRIESLEKRVAVLESKGKTQKKEGKDDASTKYSGLVGGIRYLIDNDFLNQPKTANEIHTELKREGYHHSIAPISKLLSVDFTKKQKTLNRIKEGRHYKYVKRK